MNWSKAFLFVYAILPVLSLTVSAGNIPFRAPGYYPSVAAKQAITTDINNDGVPDLVLLDNAGGVVTLLGDGHGGLAQQVRVTVQQRLSHLTVAHLNNDPFPDLAGLQANHAALSVFLNRGDGTFGPPVEYRLRGIASGISAGDLNGDSIDDLVVLTTAEPSGSVQVFLGTSTGSPRNYKTISVATPTAMALGYFDSDRRLDLAVTSYHESTVTIFRGTGSGDFVTLGRVPASSGATQMIATDLNRDGRDDLVVANMFNQVLFLENSGDGRFQPPRIFQFQSVDALMPYPRDAQRNPLVVIRDGMLVWLITRTPTGYSRRSFRFWSFSNAMAAGDWDLDGRTELALNVQDFQYDTSGYMAIVQTAANSPVLPPRFGLEGGGDKLDFNQDGHQDLLGPSYLLLGNGKGSFTKVPIAVQPYFSLFAGYINNDQAPDLIIYRSSGAVFRLNNGYGTFGPERPLPHNSYIYNILTVDLNRDGNNDLIETNDYGGWIVLATGNASFGKPYWIPQYYSCSGRPAVLDLDGDGILDIADVCPFQGGVNFWYGKGDGTFQPPLKEFDQDQASYNAIAAGDWTGNHIPDLMLFTDHTACFSAGLGNRSFGPLQCYPGPAGTIRAITADFNKDGFPDLAALGVDSSIALYFGKANSSTGPFEQPVFFGVGASFYDEVLGDFNEDGSPDLAVADDNRTYLFLNQR